MASLADHGARAAALLSAAVALTTGACGRSALDEALQLVAVTAEIEQPVPGQRGVAVHLALRNDTGAPVAVHEVALVYEGAGAGFAAEGVEPPAEIAARQVATVSFRVRLPADGSGAAAVDARAVLLDGERVVRLEGAVSPWRFVYAPASGPDLSHLPVLTVTTTRDELDFDPAAPAAAQAGPTLSLREALHLVDDLAAPHRITFDAAVFPAAGAAPIALESDLPALRIPGTALDGTGTGAAVLADETVDGALTAVLRLEAPALVVRGVTLRCAGFCQGLLIVGADGASLQDLRVVGTFGAWGMTIQGSADITLRRVDVMLDAGYSPVDLDILASDRVWLEDLRVTNAVRATASADLMLRDVRGTLYDGVDLRSCPRAHLSGLDVTGSETEAAVWLGGSCEDTVLEDSWIAVRYEQTVGVRARDCSPVTVRRTTVAAPAGTPIQPIRLEGANLGVEPAVVGAVTPTSVSGTAAAGEGVVDVYLDPGSGLGRWLGEAPLAGGGFTLGGLELPSGEWVRAVVTDASGRTAEASAGVQAP